MNPVQSVIFAVDTADIQGLTSDGHFRSYFHAHYAFEDSGCSFEMKDSMVDHSPLN